MMDMLCWVLLVMMIVPMDILPKMEFAWNVMFLAPLAMELRHKIVYLVTPRTGIIIIRTKENVLRLVKKIQAITPPQMENVLLVQIIVPHVYTSQTIV
jgi:hypothetical protein